MDYLMFFGVILFAAVASFMLGWLWYSPKMFGKIWMHELGLTRDSMPKGKMAVTMVSGFVLEVLKAFCLIFLSVSLQMNQFVLGFFIWFGFIMPILLNSVLYEKRSRNAFMINAGYQLVSIIVIGLVLYIV